MRRPARGPNDLFGDIVRDQRLQVGVDFASCVTVASEARHAELGFDHSCSEGLASVRRRKRGSGGKENGRTRLDLGDADRSAHELLEESAREGAQSVLQENALNGSREYVRRCGECTLRSDVSFRSDKEGRWNGLGSTVDCSPCVGFTTSDGAEVDDAAKGEWERVRIRESRKGESDALSRVLLLELYAASRVSASVVDWNHRSRSYEERRTSNDQLG